MEKTLNVINRMQKEGIFKQYAIAGGIAALFYIEPITTFDLDIFIILPDQDLKILSLSPLYEWLNQNGYKAEKEQVIIKGSMVQFIPAYNELTQEAVEKSIIRSVGKTRTYVIEKEYLFAIMMQTGRPKDFERMQLFWSEANMDLDKLEDLVDKFNLRIQYKKFHDRI